MRADEIREMSIDDVSKRITELEEEQFRLKFRSATEPLEDPLKLRVLRRDVARLKTILREQQAQAAQAKPSDTKAAKPAKKPAAKKTAGKTASASRG